ncbi:hypothetical protein ACFV3E_36690 [Streptomyces sp. NPDC059718]
MTPLGPVTGRFAVIRHRGGRLATMAGTAALVGTAFQPDWYAPSLAAALAATGWAAAWSLTLTKGREMDVCACVYAASPVSAAILLTVERFVGGTHWWELAMDAAWTGIVWRWRPALFARVLADREPSAKADATETNDVVPATHIPVSTHPVAEWWAANAGRSEGAAPYTALTDVEKTGPHSLRAVIYATVAGQPVPAVNKAALSAALDWPEDQIRINPIPGRGAGFKQLLLGTPPRTMGDFKDVWTEDIAPKGMPGTVITSVRAIDIDKVLGEP